VILTGTRVDGGIQTTRVYFPKILPGRTAEQFVLNSTTLEGWEDLVNVGFETRNLEDGTDLNGGLQIDGLVYETCY
jgi:hypothetical protein